ncbi:PAS domain S-box protein [Azospirillum sp. YIM DDC1]|uniref:histidine kinase n=1 Tax=Azospirillum aestuarii TaxID=2802052 RepID=A0ABS1HRK3_9PROT|nr:PAS domain S-box protein [Azospirillum aestuarii]MBK4717453.1 PAS domain S-box protein [Azospirillum aestuarii]
MIADSLTVALLALFAGLLAGFLAGLLAAQRMGPPPPAEAPSNVSGATEERLRAILDTAPIGVLINTRDGDNLYHSPSAATCFKVSGEQLQRDGMWPLYHDPRDRRAAIDRLYVEGIFDGQEVLLRRGDGETCMGSLSSTVIDFEGRRCHISWFYDLTEQKKADAVRRDLADRLEMALDATGAAVWDTDIQRGTCWWSDSFPRMLGYAEPPEMPADFWELRLHPDDRRRVLTTIDSHLRGETAAYAYDYRLRRADGGWMWIAAQGRAIRDASGRAVRYVGIMTDITERRRQEEEVRAGKERLLRILEASPIAVNITRRDGLLVFCNTQSEIILGRSRDDLLPMPAERLYADPADRQALIDRFEREGPFRDAEVRFRKPDGTIVWVLSSWGEIEMDGEPALLTWLYDINDRKAAEAAMVAARDAAERALADLRAAQESLIQAEAMASLGQLVAGVAHEINTPIGIGLTAASHIAEQARDLRVRFESGTLKKTILAEHLDTVTEAARLLVSNMNRAAALVQSFKQVAVDQTSGERRSFDLRIYIDEVLFSLRPRLKRTRVTVEVDCPEGLEMDSFPGALSQVLTNLVINALIHAYGEEQRGTIRIAVHPDGGEHIVIDFSDDGAGIPEDHLQKVFEPFFTTKRGEGGSGLGLHIVHSTVTGVLGGTVAVRSVTGQGTGFTLRLPRRIAREAAAPTAQPPQPGSVSGPVVPV